jgi:hypothetical protein
MHQRKEIRMNITHLSKILSASALLVGAAVWTNVAHAQTNETLALNIELTAVSQNATNSTNVQCVKITSRSIIQDLAASLGTTFSHRAKLVVIAPSDALDNWSAVQIMDGTNVVDVTGFFDHAQGSLVVQGSRTRGWGGSSTTVSYSVDSFSLMDQSGFTALTEHFNVSGFTVITSTTSTNRKGTVSSQTDSISAVVSGTGDEQGNPTVITGSITAESCQREISNIPQGGQGNGGHGDDDQGEDHQR